MTRIESFLKKNRETIASVVVVLTILSFVGGIYLWAEGNVKADQEKSERDLRRQYETRIADLQTSMNRINAIQILSQFAQDDHLRSVSPGEGVPKEFNLPRYKALTALTDVLMNLESPDTAPTIQSNSKDSAFEVSEEKA